MLALEEGSGPTNGLYESADYVAVHGLLRDLVAGKFGKRRASWIAHSLLVNIRADLLGHLVKRERMSHSDIRSNLKDFVARTLDY
jgi:hypothetical protein